MVEEISDITKDQLNWIMFFDKDKLLSQFYVDIKEPFNNLIFEKIDPNHTFYCPNYLGHRCNNKFGNLIYKGQIKDNKRHGFGTEYYQGTDKVKFDGKFFDDKPNGNFCKYFDENGFEIYAGHFCKGLPIGGYFFDDRNSILYIGKFKNYKLDGRNCYIIDRNDLMLASGRFIDGMPYNKEFNLYYQSGCLLYTGSNKINPEEDDDSYIGYFYHDGLFRHDGFNKIKCSTIQFPDKKTDLQADINFILNETIRGTDLMKLKYEFYENFNYTQALLAKIKDNRQGLTLYYLSPIFTTGKNIVIENCEKEDYMIMKVYYPNDNDVYAFKQICDGKYMQIIESNFKKAAMDTFFKIDEMMIDNYNEPNFICILSNSKIFDGEVSLSFNYIINDEGCKKGEFGYIGFVPKIDLTGIFRIYNTNWQQLYYGYLQSKKRVKYGISYNGSYMIQAQWEDDLITGPVRIFDSGILLFSGKANCLETTEENNIELAEPNVCDELKCEPGLPLKSSSGFTRWYHRNGKLGYLGYFKNGKRESKFAREFNKFGNIVYSGAYKENLFNGKGIEHFSGVKQFRRGIKRLGTFLNGKLNGNMCLSYNNNLLTVGSFENGVLSD